jgi:hypothetical protein
VARIGVMTVIKTRHIAVQTEKSFSLRVNHLQLEHGSCAGFIGLKLLLQRPDACADVISDVEFSPTHTFSG